MQQIAALNTDTGVIQKGELVYLSARLESLLLVC